LSLTSHPNFRYAKSFAGRSCRLAQAAVGPRDNERVDFIFDDVYGGIAGFDQAKKKGTELLTVSVARLLDDFGAPAVIDYLSLDIEGAEWYAFSTFPWHRFVFLAITVERPSTELRNKLVEVSSAIPSFSFHETRYLSADAINLSPVITCRRAIRTSVIMAVLGMSSWCMSPLRTTAPS
jgi:hypothetical protein